MKYFKTPDYVYATSLSGSTGRLDVSEALLSRFSFLCFGVFFLAFQVKMSTKTKVSFVLQSLKISLSVQFLYIFF